MIYDTIITNESGHDEKFFGFFFCNLYNNKIIFLKKIIDQFNGYCYYHICLS